MIHLARLVVAAAIVSLALVSRPASAVAEGAVAMRRMAVVVGANAAAPGRRPLRFAQRDARAVAAVLRGQAGFAGDDVRLLLDPRPAEVLAALDAALGEAAGSKADTLILFYYSGHADTASVFPGGAALPLVQLRQRLDDGRAAMRIGIIDACRGGGWTGSKGLTDAQAFDIEQVLDLATEGSVLIASSSGMEDAHESVALRGSFFTHHWNAGLRGAADRNGDDKVTLGEAFEYARSLTIRDTALETENPQHPSFRFNLRGRGDPPLAELSAGSSVIELAQESGPLQVIHLGTGLLVAELPPGRRTARVALSPGHYLVRRRAGNTVLAREVQLGAARRLAVAETSLVAIGVGSLAAKGLPDVARSAPRASLLPPDSPDSSDPPDEFLLSWNLTMPTYSITVDLNDPYGSTEVYERSDDVAMLQGSYVRRHGRYLATRLGLGVVEPTYGSAAVTASVGEAVSFPLLRGNDPLPFSSSHIIEPYLAAHVTGSAEIDQDQGEIPYTLQVGFAGGVRLSLLYAQVGYSMPILPDRVTFWNEGTYEEVDAFRPSLAIEVGLRMAFGAGVPGRRRLVGD